MEIKTWLFHCKRTCSVH